MEFISSARPSPIAGTWYSGNSKDLSRQVDAFIQAGEIKTMDLNGEVVGLVCPHAGYIYSGKTAGVAYRTIMDKEKELVVLLSPFHQFHPADLLTTAYYAYETPLGKVPVAESLVEELAAILNKDGVRLAQVKNDGEHSLEIQLPFLQRCLRGDFQLLPVMVRARDAKVLENIAGCLHQIIKDKNALTVASTDLSHFYPADIAQEMDNIMLERIREMDPMGALEAEKSGQAAACGISAVAVMLWMAKLAEARGAHILDYSTSADVTGDHASVVGYGSAVIVR